MKKNVNRNLGLAPPSPYPPLYYNKGITKFTIYIKCTIKEYSQLPLLYSLIILLKLSFLCSTYTHNSD